MAWQNVKLRFLILLYMWICSQASFEVDVNCWWNRAHPVGHNVSVVCHTSARGRAKSCDLFQLWVITPGHRHLLPSACVSAKETFNFSIAIKHTWHIRCMCNGKTDDICNVTVRGGYPPSSPSRPDCAIEDLNEDIHCSWTKSNEPMIPTIYTLHWKDCDGNIKSRESDQENVVINRAEYMKSTDITAWVTAKNGLGSAQSEESVFNTGHIIRPDPPNNITHTFMPLVIYWNMDCDSVDPLDKKCQVQYHTHDHMLDWIQEDDLQSTFPLEDSQPFTEYSFRVRCHCGYEEKVMSDWSSVFSVRTPPAAPVGQLDVWSDCVPYSDNSSCNIYWKEMPLSQARGEISNYIVTLKLKNGTEIKQVTRQSRDTGSQHRTEQNCPQLRRFPLKMGVMGVFVSANTSMGTSIPTFMLFPVRGQTTPEVNLSVMGEKQTLRVSWSVHPQFSDSVLEYVVQHVSVVPHLACLSWVRVNRTQTSVTITGDFRNYTAYNVSLYTVFNNHSTFLKSAIAYTLQGVPPKVPQFDVKIVSQSSVILMWSPIPLHESKGVILHYSVGINETGYNVSSDSTSMHLSDLQPARQYQAWVSAVSAAGEGMRSITTFSTTEENSFFTSILMAVFILLSFLILVIAFKLVWLRYCSQKIPDPLNSKSFNHMNFQHAWPWLCSLSESPLKISELEIVENLHPTTPTSPSETELEKILIDVEPQQFQVPDGLGRTNEGGEKWLEDSEESNRRHISKQDSWRKEYSEMVDTDEEEGAGGEEWWDQQGVSDYERHFMPSVEAN
ncbi:interleukin 12 receptor, beta 2a, like [Rhinichthys klamathensis goyatoka]|uniref:interleukin 12 receptor, beta 2a, like n=1 Tax=Rhinichthys klamathensis goyatoka TaxID=3034132 RepID=UPI0024B532BC|nr:interleukin 12 receptor, beta 2a, like [Rhinichthys klamathensis goyatoka]